MKASFSKPWLDRLARIEKGRGICLRNSGRPLRTVDSPSALTRMIVGGCIGTYMAKARDRKASSDMEQANTITRLE